MSNAAITPMSDHVAEFWRLLGEGYVSILVEVRRDGEQMSHWDSSRFPNDVAKALIEDRRPTPAADIAELVERLKGIAKGRMYGGTAAEAADRLAALSHRVGELEAERIIAPAECSSECDDPHCHYSHQPLTLRTAYDNAVHRMRNAEARAEAAEAKLAEAGKALEPFAKYIEGGMELDNRGQPLPDDQNLGWVYLTYADFRRARSVASTISTKGDAG